MASPLFGVRDYTGLQCHHSQGFGPVVGNGSRANERDSFDFTLHFEKSILSIGPSALFLLAFPLRWFHLRSQSRKIKKNGLLGLTKVVSKLLVSFYFS
jgi:hypothetical protein